MYRYFENAVGDFSCNSKKTIHLNVLKWVTKMEWIGLQEFQKPISDAQKDAALSCANQVAKKEREMNVLLRDADKANARLQVQLENLQDRIAELTAALEKAQGK